MLGNWGPSLAGMALVPSIIGAVILVIIVSWITTRIKHWNKRGILIIAEENNEVKKQNKKDDPKSNDKENIFDHNDQTADYKKAD